jgi:hypothetical protein
MSYPIIIDPTLTLTTSDADASLSSGFPTFNLGGNVNIFVRTASSSPINGIVLFDFSALPAGATIDSATASFYAESADSGLMQGENLDFSRITQAWVEGTQSFNPQAGSCTWNDYGAGTWATPGGDFTSTDKATIVFPSVPNWIDFDVTAQAQYAQANNNHLLDGGMNGPLGAATLPTVRFTSRESANPTKPKLVIEYTEAVVGGGVISAPISGPIAPPIITPF